jgi:hypothetical protein
MKIYQCINKVQAALACQGISKGRKNQAQGYSFRGIDDVYNVLSPLLAEHGLCILPRMLARECAERQTAKGGTMFYVTVEAEFDFVCAEDGTKHTVKTFGEAMDSGDKATNKAMSAAYKYAAFQAFAIPTEGDNDADAHTHQVMRQGDADVTAIIRGISGSASLEVLKSNYETAMQMLDKQYHATIIKAKDARKAELTEKETA